jgi:subtilisin family serine protease
MEIGGLIAMPNNDYVTGKVVVTLNRHYYCHDDTDCHSAVLDGVEYTKVENIFHSKANAKYTGDVLLVHLKSKEKESVIEAIEKLLLNPMVMFAEPDFVYDNHLVPNDPLYKYLWGLERIGAPRAWDYTTGSADITVGVVDSGVDYTHADIKDNLWVSCSGFHGWNFIDGNGDAMDATGHGTHVAGTISAIGNNYTGIAGTAWKVKIAPLKIGQRIFNLAAAIAAIDYANINGIPILNNSWGGRYYSPSLRHAIEQYDGLFIASAGNSGTDNDYLPDFPASFDCENIISVAATDSDDALTSFSNYGAKSVDIAAPGLNIYSLHLGGEYSYMNGTSMSAPHVAGAAALLMSYKPHLSLMEIKRIILASTDKFPQLEGLVASGGRLNISAMIERASANA